jgi:hypothetical protein
MKYAIALAIPAFLLFLFLQPKFKALISFFLMMQCFDLAPDIVFGMYVWDYGAILMLVIGVDVFLRKPVLEPPKQAYLVVLKIFLGWLLICFFWSLIVYQYPIMHTIKNARYLVLGYFMPFVFIRLFCVQPGSFEFLMKWIYRLSFALMPVVLIQYALKQPLLFSLFREYEGNFRTLPIFLPLCLLNFWIILAKALSSEKLAVHEKIYAALVLMTVALTYTRGIYIAVIFGTCLLVWTMSRDKVLKASSLFGVVAVGIVLVFVLLASGIAQKVGGRAASGLSLLTSSESSTSHKQKDDTFSGRLGLAAERFSLVWAHNPVFGYGFLHEDDVPAEVRNSLRYGTVLGGTAADPEAYSRDYEFTGHYILGFYTADIAWADIVISTGWAGAALLIAFMVIFVLEHYRERAINHPMGYPVKTGLFVQVVIIMLLTFDASYFYSTMHVIAFLLAGYSLTGGHRLTSIAEPVRFKNLLGSGLFGHDQILVREEALGQPERERVH